MRTKSAHDKRDWGSGRSGDFHAGRLLPVEPPVDPEQQPALALRLGEGGGGMLPAECGDGLPATPCSRMGRMPAGDAEGVVKGLAQILRRRSCARGTFASVREGGGRRDTQGKGAACLLVPNGSLTAQHERIGRFLFPPSDRFPASGPRSCQTERLEFLGKVVRLSAAQRNHQLRTHHARTTARFGIFSAKFVLYFAQNVQSPTMWWFTICTIVYRATTPHAYRICMGDSQRYALG